MHGRAAFEIRTGIFIRNHLLRVGEDHQSAIYRALKQALRDPFAKKGRRQYTRQPPSFASFVRYFHALVQLGYIEFTGREEPMEFPGKTAIPELMQVRNHGLGKSVPGVLRYYCLTEDGKREPPDHAWYDPHGTLRKLREEGLI